MTFSTKAALEIMQGFKADYTIARLPNETIDEIRAVYGYAKYSWSIRAWLGETNRAAADAAWDNRWKTAMRLLIKYGLRTDLDRELQQARNSVRANETKYNRARKAVDDLFSSHRRSNQWSVCK